MRACASLIIQVQRAFVVARPNSVDYYSWASCTSRCHQNCLGKVHLFDDAPYLLPLLCLFRVAYLPASGRFDAEMLAYCALVLARVSVSLCSSAQWNSSLAFFQFFTRIAKKEAKKLPVARLIVRMTQRSL